MQTKKLLLFLPKYEISKPIFYHLIKDYNLIINIFRARITPEEVGHIVIDVQGREDDITKAISFLTDQDIKVSENNEGMLWDSDKCAGCGSCIPHCPTKALHIASPDLMDICFDSSLCIECLNCIEICPFRACSSIF